MITKAPRYAQIITFGVPLALALLTLLLLAIPATRNAGTSMAAIAVASWGALVAIVLNAVLSQVAGVIAQRKGRNFAAFYFPGLLIGFLIPLIISLAVKKKS